jgi:hypothetical protein
VSRTIHDAERIEEMLSGCGSGDTMGYYVRGHVTKLDLLCAIAYTGYGLAGRNHEVHQEWWRNVPASIYDPEWEPCANGGDEPTIFDTCRRETPGAYPVTVVYR